MKIVQGILTVYSFQVLKHAHGNKIKLGSTSINIQYNNTF